MESIWQFLNQTKYEPLPDTVRHQAQRCFIDLIGVAVAGSTTPMAEVVHRYSAQQFGLTNAKPLLGGAPLSPAGAAFVGASIIDAMDGHDGHALTKGHVGCSLLPTLVAVAEAEQIPLTGSEFTTLFVAGYELGIRAGMAMHETANDYHASGSWMSITSAAVSAFLLNLPYPQFCHALGIAAYQGPRSPMLNVVSNPSMLKDGAGWGAFTGVSSAYMAQAGMTGSPVDIFNAYTRCYWQDLGQHWRIMDQYFKYYPCCRWAHPAVDCVKSLLIKGGFKVNQIERVEVNTFKEASCLFQGIPSNTEQAQYAMNYPVAAALIDGDFLVDHVSESGLQRPDIQAMCQKVVVNHCEGFSHKFPQQRLAQITLVLADGQTLESPVLSAKGDPDQPFSDEVLEEKFRSYVATQWSDTKADQFLLATEALFADQISLADCLAIVRQ